MTPGEAMLRRGLIDLESALTVIEVCETILLSPPIPDSRDKVASFFLALHTGHAHVTRALLNGDPPEPDELLRCLVGALLVSAYLTEQASPTAPDEPVAFVKAVMQSARRQIRETPKTDQHGRTVGTA